MTAGAVSQMDYGEGTKALGAGIFSCTLLHFVCTPLKAFPSSAGSSLFKCCPVNTASKHICCCLEVPKGAHLLIELSSRRWGAVDETSPTLYFSIVGETFLCAAQPCSRDGVSGKATRGCGDLVVLVLLMEGERERALMCGPCIWQD